MYSVKQISKTFCYRGQNWLFRPCGCGNSYKVSRFWDRNDYRRSNSRNSVVKVENVVLNTWEITVTLMSEVSILMFTCLLRRAFDVSIGHLARSGGDIIFRVKKTKTAEKRVLAGYQHVIERADLPTSKDRWWWCVRCCCRCCRRLTPVLPHTYPGGNRAMQMSAAKLVKWTQLSLLFFRSVYSCKTKCTEHKSGLKPNKSAPRGHAVIIIK